MNADPEAFGTEDQIEGGGGNDRISGDAGGDRIHGGPGDDTLDGGTGDDFVFGNADDHVLDGADGDDELSGGPGNDTLDGGTGNDVINLFDATAGVTFTLTQAADETVADLSNVGLGVDTYRKMEGVVGTGFDDIFFGSPGNDVLNGLAGANQLFGGPGQDLLISTSLGGDTLDGGAGNDVLDASLGDRTVFIYRQLFQVGGGLGGGADTIPFFDPGEDRIALIPFVLGARSLDSNRDGVLNDADRLVSVADFDPDLEGDELRIDFGGGNMLTVGATELRLGTDVTITPVISFLDFLL